MKQNEAANTIGHRVVAWMLLLTVGTAAIVGGIAITAHGYQNKFIVIDTGDGGLSNVVLCFACISIGFALYLLRAFSAKTWTPPIVGALICLAYALTLLAFGVLGLFFLAGAGIAVNIWLKIIQKRKRKDGAG